MNFSQLAPPKKFIAVCAAAVVVSAFLPWYAAGGLSVSGIDRNGDITLVLGLVGLVALASNAGIIGRPRIGERAFLAVSLICGLVVIVVSLGDWNSLASVGLYLTLLAGVAWVGMTVWAFGIARGGVRSRRRVEGLRAPRPVTPPSERRRLRGRGFFFRWIGPLVMGVAAFLAFALFGWMNSGLTGGARIAGWVGCIAIIGLALTLGSRLRRYGTRLAARDAAEALRRDARPPVVLLRSFADDETRFHASWKRGQRAAYARTYEEVMTAILQPYLGPVIAIGDPQDKLRDLGAARMYLTDDEWQEGLLDLLAEAQLVIVQAGESEGVLWEIAQVVERIPPERVVLSLPRAGIYGIDRDRYAAFRSATAGIFPKPLPEELAEAELMYFDEDWTPRPLTKHEFAARRISPLDSSPRERAISALAPTFEERPGVFWTRMVVLGIVGIGVIWMVNELLSSR